MGAFAAVLLAGGGLLAASGAAFTAVVLGQLGNAFACRSTRQSPRALGWTTNRLLLWAVTAEVAALALFLGAEPVARQLRHAPPTAVGWLLASTAPLAVLFADALDKRWRYRPRGSAT
jgi:magnesium-transporting ATPase (P-type)